MWCICSDRGLWVLYDVHCHRKLNTSLPYKSEQMHLFSPDPILKDNVFIRRNRDWECETIGQMVFAYGEQFIEPALVDGMYSFAVQRYLQMLDSLTVHFVEDEHWTYFDDLYVPNHAVSHIWEQFVPHIRDGKLAGEDLKTLQEGLAKIAQTEAYLNYGVPAKDLFNHI